MELVISGKNLELTESLKSYVEEKISKIRKYFSHIIEVDVVLSVGHTKNKEQSHVVEVTVWANGISLRGEEASGDMYSSIDLVVEKLEKQLKKYKEKLKKHGRRAEPVEELINEAFHNVVELDPDDGSSRIVRSRKFALKPMSVDEAVMQLEVMEQEFFVFSNAKTNEVNVVYKRPDGKIGWIEPEF